MNKELSRFEKQIIKATQEYGKDHIDIYLDYDVDDNAFIHGMYCSRYNSFDVTDTYPSTILNERDVKRYADSLGIGVCDT